MFSCKFLALIDPQAILLRALHSQESPLVIGKGWLDENPSRRASRSGPFCSLLSFKLKLASVLCFWQTGLEWVLEMILTDWFWDQPCFIFFFYSNRTILWIYLTPPNYLFPSGLWRSLFLSHSSATSMFCVGSPVVILRMCGRRIGFLCRRSGSSQTSGPLTQLLNLLFFFQTAKSSKFHTASWPDIYPGAKAADTLLLCSSRLRAG